MPHSIVLLSAIIVHMVMRLQGLGMDKTKPIVTARLEELSSSDIDVRNFQPEVPDRFLEYIEAEISSTAGDGPDRFSFDVCTPAWLAEELAASGGVVFGRYRIIVDRWDFSVIEAAISRLCSETTGRDWNEVATKLARYGQWQFSDYQPYQGGA